MNSEPPSSNSSRAAALQELQRRRGVVINRPVGGDDARALANLDFESAGHAIGLGQLEAAASALAEAAAAVSAGLLAALELADDEGYAEIARPDGTARRFPPGDAPDPSAWWRALASALLVRDADALKVLCEPGHVEALHAPPQTFDAFWLPLCMAAAALVRGERVPDELLAQVGELLRPERIQRATPAVVEAQLAPLLPLMRALFSSQGFESALADALAKHRRYYDSHPKPYEPYRYAPLEALGLAALAHDCGRRFDLQGMPAALIEGQHRESLTVTLVYALRYAAESEDPTGFLDLRGYPRTQRDHALLTRGADMIAHYELSGRVGVPHARAEFQLAGGGPPVPLLALDPGEKLLLAELHARDRAGVGQALEYVDAVLRAIPAGKDEIPAGAFVNARGREMYAREPGRFRRDRLQAYRDGLARASRPTDAPTPLALASIEVLQAQVTPLIEALCRARDPQALQAVKPRDEDFARVFADAPLADVAREAYGAGWSSLPPIGALRPDLTRLQVHVAPAGMLASENPLSFQFPGGYRALAPRLDPHRVWVCWRFTRPEESGGGIFYDGLVWCDDHWAWFPKPYRLLSGKATSAP